MFNIARSDTTLLGEVDSDELSETRRVVVSDSLGITEGFQDRIGLDNLVFKGNLLLLRFTVSSAFILAGTDGGKVGNNLLCVLSLTGSRFTSNQHRLVFTILDHVTVSFIGDGEEMGWHLRTTFAHVVLDDRFSVDRKSLVGVDDNTEETRVGLKFTITFYITLCYLT